MTGLDLSVEPAIRLGAFLSFLVVLALWEVLSPRRRQRVSRRRRWPNNLGISAINSALLALLVLLIGSGIAVVAGERGWGLFNRLQLAPLPGILLYIVAFDLTIYLQHRLFHRFDWLWRLHRVHHTDLDYDVSTGVRFHPLSIIISAGIKFGLVLLLGPPAVAVLIAEVVLNATSMFNHSNIKLPARLDRVLRLFVVTPDMHRVHHSADRSEHERNFGFNFPWWDRLFRTYKERPDAGHEGMRVGIDTFEEADAIGLYALLAQPFRRSRRTE